SPPLQRAILQFGTRSAPRHILTALCLWRTIVPGPSLGPLPPTPGYLLDHSEVPSPNCHHHRLLTTAVFTSLNGRFALFAAACNIHRPAQQPPKSWKPQLLHQPPVHQPVVNLQHPVTIPQ